MGIGRTMRGGLAQLVTVFIAAIVMAGFGLPLATARADGAPTVPDPPTDITVTAGLGYITVMWTPPVNDGGNPLTGYTVNASNGQSIQLIPLVGNLTNISYPFVGKNTYTFTVQATNVVGTSAESVPSAEVFLASGVPDVVANVVATAGDAQASVTWDPPVNDGGSAILNYTVTAGLVSKDIDATETSATLTGLTNGTVYEVSVVAVNEFGTGPEVLSNAVTPSAPPSPPAPPTDVVATAGDGQAVVSWTASAGGGVDTYSVTAWPSGTVVDVPGDQTTATVTGLTNGIASTFTLTAKNANGPSLPSGPSLPVTPAGIPGTPTDVRASVIAGGAFSVAWTAPSANGASIKTFTVRASPGNASVVVSGHELRATFASLRDGTYTFRVRAANAVGAGAFSSPSAPVTRVTIRDPNGFHTLGYWMLGADGHVYGFGSAGKLGSAPGPAVAIAARRDGAGYWVTDAAGNVSHFGATATYGGKPVLPPGEHVSTISATPSGNGYWLFTDRGRVFPRGDAHAYGDLAAVPLNGPIVASVATASGHGYYMVGTDGGIFAFGDAKFHGSMGGAHLNRPVVGISPTPDGHGYWLVASDGGVFAFRAPFRGSMGGAHLNRAVNGLVAFGNGYLMVASDGGVFDFSNKPFLGSLAAKPPTAPIIGIAAFAT